MKQFSLALTTMAGAMLVGASAQAVSLNLTAGGNGTVNTAIFTTTDNQATGSGVIDSFVRLNQGGPQGAVVDGYNADARPVMDDVNTSPTFTHDITLGSVPVVNLTGVDYYEFLLDINQQNSDPLLSLDELQIYTRAGAIGVGDNLATLAGSSDLRYDLDGAGDSEVLLNYNLNSGSGSGDLFVYIPKSLFAGDPNTDFVYLYSQFGASTTPPPNWENNDGFEEWAVRTTNPVPDGGLTIALLGFSLTGLGVLRRKLAAR